jgi:hypothetical protein
MRPVIDYGHTKEAHQTKEVCESPDSNGIKAAEFRAKNFQPERTKHPRVVADEDHHSTEKLGGFCHALQLPSLAISTLPEG